MILDAMWIQGRYVQDEWHQSTCNHHKKTDTSSYPVQRWVQGKIVLAGWMQWDVSQERCHTYQYWLDQCKEKTKPIEVVWIEDCESSHYDGI
jgi:fatty-acid desaturase